MQLLIVTVVWHRFKLESESQLQLKQNELSQWEAKIKCDRDKTTSLQSEITKLSAELQSERDKADRLQSLLNETMARQITLQGQKDVLQQKVDQASTLLFWGFYSTCKR